MASGYLANQIEEQFGDGSTAEIQITYSRESQPLGTGGALRNCLSELDDRFYVLNGDTLFDANYFALHEAMSKSHESPAGVIALRQVSDVARYGLVVLKNDKIVKFAEKQQSGVGLINGGVYLLNRCVVEGIVPHTKISLENQVFPELVKSERLIGIEVDGYFIDIGLPETLMRAQEELPEWQRRPVAFLDRDGVINVDTGYLHRSEDCEWVQDAPQAIRLLNESGYLVIVVTNQAGIGRGFYTENEFWQFMDWYRDTLAQHGAHLDDVFF